MPNLWLCGHLRPVERAGHGQHAGPGPEPPRIVLWSIGNEIPEGREGRPPRDSIAQRLAAICHREDPTRPVTSACPGPDEDWKSGLAKALDVFGVNYNPDFYRPECSRKARGTPRAGPTATRAACRWWAAKRQSQVDTRSASTA